MSLGSEFTQLMEQVATALPERAINMASVDNIARSLDRLQALEQLAARVDPASGRIRNLQAGSIVLDPHGLRVEGDQTLAVFTGGQVYNAESVEDGDIIFGNNSDNQANILWDKSSGELQFRGGTTKQGWIDTSGAAVFGGGVVTLDDNGIGIEEGQVIAHQIRWRLGDSTQTFTGRILSYGAAGANATWRIAIDGGYQGNTTTPGYGLVELNARAGGNSSGPLSQVTLLQQANGISTAGELWKMVEYRESDLTTYFTMQSSRWLFNTDYYDMNFAWRGTTKTALAIDAVLNKPLLPTTSLSSNSVGAAGAIAVDGNYIYVHDSTEWRRAALSTF